MKQPILFPIALLLLLCVGCNGTLVSKAERTASVSLIAVDSFLKVEYDNRDMLGEGVQKSANVLRKEFPPAWLALRSATKAYKANRTDENKADLKTAISVVESLTESTRNYLKD